nr:immunoglobulin heavy chain junction region [Mus musculus]
CAKLGYYFDYW